MDVLRVQLQLKKAGYKGKDGKELVLDGKFGPNTEYALKQYQKDNGLVADGIAGPKTYGKMYGVEEGNKIRQRETPVQKKNIQVRAKVRAGYKRAYDWGPIKITESMWLPF
ncbi:MAG: hypothetical protein PWR10_477 [Halanaerobiales bacterium]|nr:hypothetical protein [Halanaerobiales bacterium]